MSRFREIDIEDSSSYDEDEEHGVEDDDNANVVHLEENDELQSNDEDSDDTPHIINIISQVLDGDSLESLKQQSIVNNENSNNSKLFATLYDMIVNKDGALHKSFDDIYWDLVHALITSLDDSSSSWDQKNPHQVDQESANILKILNWMSLNTSPREFLLVIEELHESSFFQVSFFTRLSLIGLIENSLKRIPVEKRYHFFKSLLPMIMSLVQKEKQNNDNIKTSALSSNSTFKKEDGEEEEGEGNEEELDDKQSVQIQGHANEEELQQKNTSEDLKWEYPLSSILKFLQSFIRDLNIDILIDQQQLHQNQTNQESKLEITKQQHLFLQFIIQLLGEDHIVNPPQPLTPNSQPILCVIGELLVLLGVPFEYIIKTDQRFREKRRELELEDMYFDQGLDEEDIEEDENLASKKNKTSNEDDVFDDDDEVDNTEEMLWDIELSYTGIGYLYYNLLLRPTEQYKLPSVLSPHSLLKDNLPYIISLLQSSSYKIGFKAIQIISFIQKRIKPSAFDIPLEYLNTKEISEISGEKNEKWLIDMSPAMVDETYHFLQMIQSVISFLVKCPVQKIRSFAFNQLTQLMNIMTPATRFNLLTTLIRTCIFPTFTGLLIHIFKEQIDGAWLSTDIETRAYFVSPKIIELLSIPMQVGGNLLERMDSIMNALNLYRYLLIRDKNDNSTGIWARSKFIGARDQFLIPLKSEFEKIKELFESSAKGDKDAIKKALKGVSKMGIEDMDEEEIKKASQLVVFHIEMAIDVINRIFELQDTLKSDDDE